MTSPDLPSGTDRLHAVSQQIPADIYVNIQGDEPLLHPDHITDILAPFAASRTSRSPRLKSAARPKTSPTPTP